METNIILAGVGGQGIVSISFVIDMAALDLGLHFKQSEVHGMSQRGGAVQSHVRLSDKAIHSDLIPHGCATLILAIEPLEGLRYYDFLSPDGAVVCSTAPHVNIPDYGDLDAILSAIATVPNHVLVPAERLARQAGSSRAQNMAVLGAAAHLLPISPAALEHRIRAAFHHKGDRVQSMNVTAFRLGQAGASSYRALTAAAVAPIVAATLVGRLANAALEPEAAVLWKRVFDAPIASAVLNLLGSPGRESVAGDSATPARLLDAVGSVAEQLSALLYC